MAEHERPSEEDSFDSEKESQLKDLQKEFYGEIEDFWRFLRRYCTEYLVVDNTEVPALVCLRSIKKDFSKTKTKPSNPKCKLHKSRLFPFLLDQQFMSDLKTPLKGPKVAFLGAEKRLKALRGS